MNSELIDIEDLKESWHQIEFLDVRAPVEFQAGHIPGSVNLPILNDLEREKIGKTYRQQGSQSAVELGYELVSGDIKSARVQAWVHWLNQKPERMILCFRGGMRSQIAQAWCQEQGLARPRLRGGYKSFRQFLLNELHKITLSTNFLIVGGVTGSGKSEVLRQAQQLPLAILDLEKIANHRGSVFGSMPGGQPQQAHFENLLGWTWLRLQHQHQYRQLALEDESRLIGHCVIPDHLFAKMRSSDVVLIEEPLEKRVDWIYKEYVENLSDKDSLFVRYQSYIHRIEKKLGGARAQEILQDLENCRRHYKTLNDLSLNRLWIEKLLNWYYDPLYRFSLERRNPHVTFRGSRREVLEYLKSSCAIL